MSLFSNIKEKYKAHSAKKKIIKDVEREEYTRYKAEKGNARFMDEVDRAKTKARARVDRPERIREGIKSGAKAVGKGIFAMASGMGKSVGKNQSKATKNAIGGGYGMNMGFGGMPRKKNKGGNDFAGSLLK